MWILRSGTVAVLTPGSPSALLLARLGPGSPVGEMALVDHGPRSADVVAKEDVEAFVVTAEEFSRILLEDPDLGQRILVLIAKQLASRLRDTTEDLRITENCA
jgi:CRP-like cAMP-binding protein